MSGFEAIIARNVLATLMVQPRMLRITVRTDFIVFTDTGVKFHWMTGLMKGPNRIPSDDPRHGESVRNATVTIDNTSITDQTDRQGIAELDISNLPGEPDANNVLHNVLRITPEHVSTDPVGPLIADPLTTDPPNRIYRELEIDISTSNGSLTAASVRIPPGVTTEEMTWGKIGNRVLPQWDPVQYPNHLPVDLKPIWMRDRHDPQASRIRATSDLDKIVVHCTGGDIISGALNTFIGGGPSSINYLVDIDGHIIKLKRDNRRAGHIGPKVRWQGTPAQAFSIGIEVVHNPQSGIPYPDIQFNSLHGLLQRLLDHYPSISRSGVIGHCDVGFTPTLSRHKRESCPGPYFDWPALENEGIGLKEEARIPSPSDYSGFFTTPGAVLRENNSGPAIRELNEDLSHIGYWVNVNANFSRGTTLAVRSFQAHFFTGRRSRAITGQVDAYTAGLIKSVRSQTP